MSAASTSIPTRTHFDHDVEEKLTDFPFDEHADWWCVTTAPFPCPAQNCGFIAKHLTAAHRIIVWPEIDDRRMLTYCADARNLGRDPRPVLYEHSFGPCISYDAWIALGRPIHGKIQRPDGVEFRRL